MSEARRAPEKCSEAAALRIVFAHEAKLTITALRMRWDEDKTLKTRRREKAFRPLITPPSQLLVLLSPSVVDMQNLAFKHPHKKSTIAAWAKLGEYTGISGSDCYLLLALFHF